MKMKRRQRSSFRGFSCQRASRCVCTASRTRFTRYLTNAYIAYFLHITLIKNDNWILAPIELQKCFLNVLTLQLLTYCADNEFQLSTTLLLKTNFLVSKRNLLLNSFFSWPESRNESMCSCGEACSSSYQSGLVSEQFADVVHVFDVVAARRHRHNLAQVLQRVVQ